MEVETVLIGLFKQVGQGNAHILHVNVFPIAHEQGISALVYDIQVDHFEIFHAEELEGNQHFAAAIALGQLVFFGEAHCLVGAIVIVGTAL